MSLLTAEGLCKSFGGLAAISNVGFEICPQEILALIGPNGAGKTTLLNLITNFITPDSGAIQFQGRSIQGLPRHTIVDLGIARTFQALTVFEELSVGDNLMIGQSSRIGSSLWDAFRPANVLRVLRGDRGAADGFVGELMDFVQLDAETWNRPVNTLSVLDKKRVAIASALASQPKLVLLDEPLAGLNQSESMELLDLIRAVKAAGNSVLLIDHNLEAVMSVAERVLVLNFGELIRQGTPEEIISCKKVSEIYLGK